MSECLLLVDSAMHPTTLRTVVLIHFSARAHGSPSRVVRELVLFVNLQASIFKRLQRVNQQRVYTGE